MEKKKKMELKKPHSSGQNKMKLEARSCPEPMCSSALLTRVFLDDASSGCAREKQNKKVVKASAETAVRDGMPGVH